MKFRELNPSYLTGIKQRFLEVFSCEIEKELGVKKFKCPLCSKNDIQVWVKILDMGIYADKEGTPYEVIGEIDHCTCTNCGIIFFPTTIKAKKNPPGNYTSYPHLYHFYVRTKYSMGYKELQRLLCS